MGDWGPASPPTSNPEESARKHGRNVVLVIDFGSQYTHLITRRIRELSICSFCIAAGNSLEVIKSYTPGTVILSGGPHSVHEDDAPSLPDGFFEYVQAAGITVLGICYGLQLIVKLLGGEVRQGKSQEYGAMKIVIEGASRLFGGFCGEKEQEVWMSHGDEAVKLPQGFKVVASSWQGGILSPSSSPLSTISERSCLPCRRAPALAPALG